MIFASRIFNFLDFFSLIAASVDYLTWIAGPVFLIYYHWFCQTRFVISDDTSHYSDSAIVFRMVAWQER